jgi:predicted O-methyltransferase YrrM
VVSFADALELIEGVEGWLTGAQARTLWDAARRVPAEGTIVEIGSFRGRSTIVLALAADASAHVVAIDPHGGGDRGPQEIAPDRARGDLDHAAFCANLERAGVAGRVMHVRVPSAAALGAIADAVDLLYVDGAHRYGPARADIERWGGRVRQGGAMLIHDAFSALGVTMAQARGLMLSPEWRYRGRVGSLAQYTREPLGSPQRVLNAARQAAAFAYFARNLLVKVLITLRLTGLLGRPRASWPY